MSNPFDGELQRLETRLEQVREHVAAASWASSVADVWLRRCVVEMCEARPENYIRFQKAAREVVDLMSEELARRTLEERELVGLVQSLRAEAARYRGN